MTRETGLQRFGRAGEELAARYLERLGWRIVGRNVRHGHGEIDIVAVDGEELVIVEVRSRTGGTVQPAEMSVGPRKMSRLLRAARGYVEREGWSGFWRVDIVALTVDPRDPAGEPGIELFSDITMGMEAERI